MKSDNCVDHLNLLISSICYFFIFIIVTPTLSAQTNYNGSDINIASLVSNMEFLASDELEGRDSGSRGGEIASLFIASELKKYGLTPFGSDGSYFQYFDAVASKYNPESSLVIKDKNNEETYLELITDYVIDPPFIPNGQYVYDEKEIIFVRYGITAPEYNYDDYAGIDIKDKIVVAISGEPYNEETGYFTGEKKSLHAGFHTKLNLATQKGAAAFIYIGSKKNINDWLGLLVPSNENVTLSLPTENANDPVDEMNTLSLLLSCEALTQLFENEQADYAAIDSMMQIKTAPQPFTLSKKMKPDVSFCKSKISLRNVVGIINGSDPALSSEYVTIGAHYDHIGISDNMVFNGADDNGSGVVTALECARILNDTNNNKRPIVIIFYAAEEKGLLGSKYFIDAFDTQHKITANLNLDMVGREDENTLNILGSEECGTELRKIIENANRASAKFNFNFDLEIPGRGSDYLNYIDKEIPVAFFFDDLSSDVHQPTDDFDKINYNKIVKVTNLVRACAENIANLDHRLK